jgi:long-chain acyl-CoA synthetase
MDRIAFALQRDGVRAGEAVAIYARTSINYAAAFCGVLAAGAAVAPLAQSSTPTSLMMMLRDSGARVFMLDRETAKLLQGTSYEEAVKRVALDGSEAGEAFSRWLGPEGAKPACVSIAPTNPSTSSIPPARPVRPRASFSRTACASDSSSVLPTGAR